MKTGDLVKLKKPTTRDFDKVFIVVDTMIFAQLPRYTQGEENAEWLRLDGPESWVTSGWSPAKDYEVVSESGNKSKTQR